MKIVIEGEPVPQARPRFTRTGIAYTLDKCKRYREEVATTGKLYMRAHHLQPLESALAVQVSIFRSVPKSWSKTKQAQALRGELRPSTKPDLDNYVKAVLDGLTRGGVWADDNLIVSLAAEKYYSNEPRVEVEVSELW